MPENIDGRVRYSDEEIKGLVKNIADQINEKRVSIDIIIAIANGGWIPARMLLTYLNFDDQIYSLGIINYDKNDKRLENPILTQGLPPEMIINGKTILLIDEVAHSGGTFKFAREYLNSLGASKIYTASLHRKDESEFTPDFVGEFRDNAWIVYPWDIK